MKRFNLATAAVLASSALPATAAQVVLAPTDVYATTGDYDYRFTADNILDQQSGAIDETDQDGTYWLNPNSGPAVAKISIDLGSTFKLTSFDLFNSHNAGFNDRNTGNFVIIGSNSASFGSFTTLASGTLSQEYQGTPLTAQSFTSQSASAFRYLQFQATSMVSGGFTHYGLNELRVFGDAATLGVPEPANWALMIGGFGAVGAAARRRVGRRMLA